MPAYLLWIVVAGGLVLIAGLLWMHILRDMWARERGAVVGASDGTEEREAPPTDPRMRILRGLQDLLRRDPDSAFVVFEHRDSDQFVQFKPSETGVMLDLPVFAMPADAQQRAKALFERLALDPQTFTYRQRDGGSGIDIVMIDFGADVERAADVGVAIFREVHGVAGELRLYEETE